MMRMLLLLGATKNNSLVAISTGLLNSMTEEEAEAVLAHEVSHIDERRYGDHDFITGRIEYLRDFSYLA